MSARSAYGDGPLTSLRTSFGEGSMPGASLLGVHVKASLVKFTHAKAYHKAQNLAIPPAGQVWKSYCFSGSVRIAIRVQVNGAADQVNYLLADHDLAMQDSGSTAITVDVNNSKQSTSRE